MQSLPGLSDAIKSEDLESTRNEFTFAHPLGNWQNSSSVPVLTAVPMAGIETVEDLLPRFRAFLQVTTVVATEKRGDENEKTSRPSSGAGYALFRRWPRGWNIYRGAILRVLLKEANRHAGLTGEDVVFLFQDRAAFALAQQPAGMPATRGPL